MEYVILAVLGLVILLMPVLLLVLFSFIAVVIFVWRKMFPLGWGIAEWVTNRRNLIPFVLFLLIVIAGSIILLIVSYVFASQVHGIGYLFLLLFLLILFIAEIIFWGGLGLAVILWIVRLSHWAYALFRRGFWRTFRPGGPPDFQPVPVPLTNPLLVAPPPVKPSYYGKRRKLSKRRPTDGNPIIITTKKSEVKAQASTQQKTKAQVRTQEESKKAKVQSKAKSHDQVGMEKKPKIKVMIKKPKTTEVPELRRRRRLKRNK